MALVIRLTDGVQCVQLVLAVRQGPDDLVSVIVHLVPSLLHIYTLCHNKTETETESVILLEHFLNCVHHNIPNPLVPIALAGFSQCHG